MPYTERCKNSKWVAMLFFFKLMLPKQPQKLPPVDGPRDYHTKSVRQGKTNIIWYCLYMEPKKRYKWTYLQNRDRLTDKENKRMVTKGERGGRHKLGVWDWNIHTTIYKIDNQQGSTV